jgi:hypothetical protein
MPAMPRSRIEIYWKKNRDGAGGGDRASPRYRRLRLRLSTAISVQAHEGRLGQCCLWQALGGARDLLEAVCRDPPEEEGRGAELFGYSGLKGACSHAFDSFLIHLAASSSEARWPAHRSRRRYLAQRPLLVLGCLVLLVGPLGNLPLNAQRKSHHQLKPSIQSRTWSGVLRKRRASAMSALNTAASYSGSFSDEACIIAPIVCHALRSSLAS